MRKLILIADDNAQYRKLLSDALQAAGYDTLTVENGERAVELARSARPSLILKDVQMPLMDGLTAVRALKADHKTQFIRAIAITALAMDGDCERVLLAGFDGYLGKPISIKELRSVVASQINQASGISEQNPGDRNP